MYEHDVIDGALSLTPDRDCTGMVALSRAVTVNEGLGSSCLTE